MKVYMRELRAMFLPWVLFGGTVGFSHVSNSCLLRFWKSEPLWFMNTVPGLVRG